MVISEVEDLDTTHLQNISTEYAFDRMSRILLSLKRVSIQRKFMDLKSNFLLKNDVNLELQNKWLELVLHQQLMMDFENIVSFASLCLKAKSNYREFAEFVPMALIPSVGQWFPNLCYFPP